MHTPPARLPRTDLRVWVLLLLGSIPVSLLSAQTAPAPQPTEEEEPMVLSPFVVHESDEVGYVATSSLAGSRVKTELKDIASQIDVMTPEFLNDIGAQSIADAVVYSSNFGGPMDQNISGNDGIASTKLEARARGMDNATVSSDFFATNLPNDLYNVERLNLAYGAQSVLFGLGNAGGVLDSATKRASMKNNNSVEFRVDTWGGQRGMLDLNRELIDSKLALRIVGLDSHAKHFTEGGRNRQQRLFGTLTFRPFRDTTIRASYEKVRQEVQVATNYISYDMLSPWVAAGRPLFDNSKGNGSITSADTLYAKNNNALRVLSYGTPNDSLLVWNGSAVTLGPQQLPGVVDPRKHSLMDDSVYPVDMDPRVRARQNDIDGYIARAFIEQKITPDWFVELAGNYERRNEKSGGPFNLLESIDIRADPNKYLPGGTAKTPQTALNPNAGRLYIESYPQGSRGTNETLEARLTTVYEFDAARKLKSMDWLGRHRFAGLWSFRQDIDKSQDDRAMVIGETPFTTGDKMHNSRLLRARYYLDSPSDPNRTGNFQAIPIPGAGIFGPWTLTDPATGTPYQVTMFDNPDGHYNVPVGAKLEDQTMMVAWQSFFWKNRIAGFVGIRRDEVKTFNLRETDIVRQDFLVPGDQKGLYRSYEDVEFSDSPEAEATTTLQTYGIVVHPLKWLSLFYNRSENTALPPGKLGPWGNNLNGVSSHGFDWGARFSLWDNRFVLRLNVYEDNQTDYWANPFQGLRDDAAAIERRLRGDDRPAGIPEIPAAGFDPIRLPVGTYRSNAEKTTKGGDAVLVANITRQWDLRLAVGYQRNLLVSRGRDWIKWVGERLPVWQNFGGLGWDNVTVSSSNNQTIHEFYEKNMVTEMASLQTAVGTQRFREREWRANAFSSYRFAEGALKGFNFGGGIRWWGPGNTGNGGMYLPGIADPVVDPSILHRDANSQLFVDAMFGYRRQFKVGSRRMMWRVQVNIRNLLQEDDYEVARSNYAGDAYEFLRVAPRQTSVTFGVNF